MKSHEISKRIVRSSKQRQLGSGVGEERPKILALCCCRREEHEFGVHRNHRVCSAAFSWSSKALLTELPEALENKTEVAKAKVNQPIETNDPPDFYAIVNT